MGPTNTNTSQKRGIKILLIVGAILIVGLVAFVLILSATTNKSSSDSSSENVATTPVVTLSDLEFSFADLAKALIYGPDSEVNEIDLSVPLDDWQLTKVANDSRSTAAKTQATYADALLPLQETFTTTLENYLAQYPDSDLSALDDKGTILEERIIATIIYLHGDKITQELIRDYIQAPDNVNVVINEEFAVDNGVIDPLSVNIISTVFFYYQNIIERTQILIESGCVKNKTVDTSCISVLRNNYDAYPKLQQIDNLIFSHATEANEAFSEIMASFPQLLFDINDALGGINE